MYPTSAFTPADLVSAGYRQFRCTHYKSYTVDGLGYQKTVRNVEEDKLYFISVYFSDWRKVANVERPPTWEVEVQFKLPPGDSVDVSLLFSHTMTIADIEQFYAQNYERMQYLPYEVSTNR